MADKACNFLIQHSIVFRRNGQQRKFVDQHFSCSAGSADHTKEKSKQADFSAAHVGLEKWEG